MNFPLGGSPPQHRHNFEELFIIQEGDISFNFRGEKKLVSAGEVINIPANAPHNFQNSSDKAAKMLCMCSPAGQEEYFMEVGDILKSRTEAPPNLTEAEQMARKQKAQDLALRYQTEFI
jgi:mannose-6-phosphate isomerase-like protein (cupin superfamily)